MTNPLISIIVPVYNVEKYLSQCLDSILSQTYTNWEAILVDDGSKDNSGKICDEYTAKDSRFKVFHQENGGVSSARNFGIDNARGEWITFVDADDIIAENYISAVKDILIENKCGTVTSSSYKMTDEGKKYPYVEYPDLLLTTGEFVKKELKHYVSWGFFFQLSIIKRYNIQFDTRLNMSEDALFIMQYLGCIETVQLTSQITYYYRINMDSVCKNGMNYAKSLNHYNASILLHAMKGTLNLEDSAIMRAMIIQFKWFLSDLCEIKLKRSELRDAQQKISKLYNLTKGYKRPKMAGLAKYSLVLYKILFLCKNFLKYSK